jgi:hypothetical protein
MGGKHGTIADRIDKDFYPTPDWVTTLGLLSHLNVSGLSIWEPCTGAGDIAEALKTAGAQVFCSDIEDRGYPLDAHIDFTAPRSNSFALNRKIDGIITNFPFSQAILCIKSGLMYIREHGGFMASIFLMDFLQRPNRRELFFNCPEFAAYILLTERVTWFKNPLKKEAPKENHVWVVWDARKQPGKPPAILSSPGDDFYALPRKHQLEIVGCVAKSSSTLKPEAKSDSATEANSPAPEQ